MTDHIDDDDMNFLHDEGDGPLEGEVEKPAEEDTQPPEEELEKGEEKEEEPPLETEPEATDEDNAEEPQEPTGPPKMFKRAASQNVTIDHETLKELAKGMNVIALSLFNMTSGELNDNAEIFNPETLDMSGASEEYAEATGDALGFIPGDSLVEDALSREGSDWRQVIESEHGKFGMSFRAPATGGKEKLTGADAT